MPDAPPTGFVRPAVRTAALSIGTGWGVAAAVAVLAGGSDLRVPSWAWLVAHGSGLRVGEARFGVVPLGVTLLAGALVALVARRATQADLADLGPFAGTVGMIFGVVSAVLAAVTATDTVVASIPRSAVGGFLVGGLGSAVGAGWRHRHSLAVPDAARLVLLGTGRALRLILGVALVLVALLLAVHAQRAAELWGALDPGLAGGVLLAGACVLSVPTLVAWAVAVLVGPGFMIGTHTSVDLTGAHLGPVPGFPTLAAIPGSGEFPWWVLLLGLVLPIAGVRAGLVSPRPAVGAVAGAVAGGVLGSLLALSGGGLGPGRLVEAGPAPVMPLVIAVLGLAATGALGSLLAHYRGRRVGTVPSAPGRPGLWRRDEPAGPDRRGRGT